MLLVAFYVTLHWHNFVFFKMSSFLFTLYEWIESRVAFIPTNNQWNEPFWPSCHPTNSVAASTEVKWHRACKTTLLLAESEACRTCGTLSCTRAWRTPWLVRCSAAKMKSNNARYRTDIVSFYCTDTVSLKPSFVQEIPAWRWSSHRTKMSRLHPTANSFSALTLLDSRQERHKASNNSASAVPRGSTLEAFREPTSPGVVSENRPFNQNLKSLCYSALEKIFSLRKSHSNSP